ncbi:hypothetical protein MKEN_00973200 [Mycena kentingensis (nom. inval.)]|nr:hypothetical protein MKEN_00973200 [Mycena kentingensis (nom. inval.)]
MPRVRLEDDSARLPDKALLPSNEREARRKKRAWYARWLSLSVASIFLHLGLVAVHVVLFILARRGTERRAVFPISDQSKVSFYVTASSTGIAILYLTAILFITQRLAVQANLRARQTLTATHDNIASWNGLGSAVVAIFGQRTVRASLGGTLAIAAYLAGITAVHISTPALFSVAAFNSTTVSTVDTIGLPIVNFSTAFLSEDATLDPDLQFTEITLDFFPWFSNLAESQRVGLVNGTLYNSLNTTSWQQRRSGTALVSATGNEINCGYLPGLNNKTEDGEWTVFLGGGEPGILTDLNPARLSSTGPNITSINSGAFGWDVSIPNALILFTTNEVVDSSGSSAGGHPVDLSVPMGVGDSSSSRGQFLLCSRRLVNQTGVVSLESGLMDPATLTPDIVKRRSSWKPYTDVWSAAPVDYAAGGELGGDLWAWRISGMASTPIPRGGGLGSSDNIVTSEDFVMERLNLDPTWIVTGNNTPASAPRPKIYLHDIENALAELAATIFWLAGHVKIADLEMAYVGALEVNSVPALVRPATLVASANTEEPLLQARLELNIIAVYLGLGVSIAVCILGLGFAFSSGFSASRSSISGTGILHILWLSRNHPELHGNLAQVAKPSDNALRAAGMVPIRFADGKELRTNSLSGRTISVDSPNYAKKNLRSSWIRVFVRQTAGVAALHVLLLLLHCGFMAVIAYNHAEHGIVYPITAQKATSLWVTILSTTFGTVYLALLLYVTQRTALQTLLHARQPLVAAHDQTISWSGLGAASLSLYRQFAVPSSISGALCIFFYLVSLAGLHLTIPTVITVQTFNQTVAVNIPTTGVPTWTAESIANNGSIQFIQDVSAFFDWRNTLDASNVIGLANHTLYEALAEPVLTAQSPVDVSVVAFSVSCGYPLSTSITLLPNLNDRDEWNVTVEVASGQFLWFNLPSSGPNLISTFPMITDAGSQPGVANDLAWPSLILYTTSPVVDSSGATSQPVVIPKPFGLNNSVTAIQLLQCTRSSVNTTGKVDGATRILDLASLGGDAQRKSASKWDVFNDPAAAVPIMDRLHDPRGPMESGLWPAPGFALDSLLFTPPTGNTGRLSQIELYLMEQLSLDIGWMGTADAASTPVQKIVLHDLENALADFAAAFFWSVSYIRPPSLVTKYKTALDDTSKLIQSTPPVMTTGFAVVQKAEIAARLNFNLLAVSLGLGFSILSTLFALGLTRHIPTAELSSGSRIRSFGILQIIWLSRNNPQLAEVLGDDIGAPTDDNLRAAGKQVVRLVDTCA